jgi:hypothetical protein
MGIYTIQQSTYDRLNHQLSKTFNVEYVQIELSDEERTFETYHSLRSAPSKTGRTSEDFTEEWKRKISNSKLGQRRIQSKQERHRRSEKAKNTDMSMCKGRIWVNDGIKSFRIYPEKLPNSGYNLGRL